jgi:hypothetical protein
MTAEQAAEVLDIRRELRIANWISHEPGSFALCDRSPIQSSSELPWMTGRPEIISAL